MNTQISPSIAEPAVEARPTLPPPVAKGDTHIWAIYILLCIISVVELFSASSREVSAAGLGVYGTIVRHGLLLLVGFMIIIVLQRTHYGTIMKWLPIFVLGCIGLMIYTMFCGKIINGARRNVSFGFFDVQSAEFLKLAAAAAVAFVMSRCQLKNGGVKTGGVVFTAILILLFCAMLAPQGLTNTLLLMSISFSMMIIGGIGAKKLLIVLAVYGAAAGCYKVYDHLSETESRSETWGSRWESFVGTGQPKYERPITSDNRQEMLGYIAQANGGPIGVLPGNSRETARLPLAFTDYIYAIIVEETGLVGGLLVLVVYLWLLGRASGIASKCSRAFPALLVIGMALTVVIQALFHICIVVGVIPVSGQPLPLISKGGTSILVTSIAFGVMLSVSRFAVRTGSKTKDIKNEIDTLPTEMAADNPSQLS